MYMMGLNAENLLSAATLGSVLWLFSVTWSEKLIFSTLVQD